MLHTYLDGSMSDQEGPWPRSVASIALRMGAGLRSSQVGDPTSKLVAERAAQVAVLSNPSKHFARSPPFKMNNVPRDHELIMEVIFLPRQYRVRAAISGIRLSLKGSFPCGKLSTLASKPLRSHQTSASKLLKGIKLNSRLISKRLEISLNKKRGRVIYFSVLWCALILCLNKFYGIVICCYTLLGTVKYALGAAQAAAPVQFYLKISWNSDLEVRF
ncbi:hypothetical protein NC652_012946 [Populus alba x Populus x berolinensis]|nr:hypothetical protein NC652_012946 [Populus alba x Populus x berolinensis]